MRMERFVRMIVAGGLALVAGLWIAILFEPWSNPWLIGVALSLFGTGSLFAGITSEIDI